MSADAKEDTVPDGTSMSPSGRERARGHACAPPPPLPAQSASRTPLPIMERPDEGTWWCITCCEWWQAAYRHPSHPNVVCSRCDRPLNLEERRVEVLHALVQTLATSRRRIVRPPVVRPEAPTEPRAGAEDRLLGAEDVAALLGCTRKAVFNRHARGQLPGGFRMGRSLRWRSRELLPYLFEGRAPSPKGSRR